VCAVVFVVVVILQNKIKPVVQTQSLDEENYFRLLQHSKT
jgi:hypothetical protein